STLVGDATRLRQVLTNLLGNAIKFTESGQVTLAVRRADGAEAAVADAHDTPCVTLELSVTDTGVGISNGQLSELFQAFSQADSSTTRKFGGTGLGLAISKRLAEMLGGDVTVTSEVGKGSTFRVTAATGPLEDVEMIDAQVCVNRDVATPQEKPLPGTPLQELDCRVLLAEDGLDNQRLIAFVLKKAGAQVAVAENGQIACEKAMQASGAGEPFDVILMDMQMPVMDGYDATGKLRETGYVGPIIALTAHAMSTDRDKCLNAGCDDYLAKPIDREKLIATVAQYASRRKLHHRSDVR
ncbi:MAG: response regulator, partial [Candidatus Nealsonbacteria bacterium]|nr:response regulator [Candidatus Nealsonbacteria bacterium]